MTILPFVSNADSARDITHKSFEYYKKGEILFEKNQCKEAIEFFNKAIDLTPGSILAYTAKGVAQNRLKQYNLALNTYDKALKIKRGKVNIEKWKNVSVHIYINKSITLMNLERHKEALDTCDKGLVIIQHPYLYNTKGAALAALNKYEEAIDSYNQAIELDPNYFEPHQNKFCPLRNLKRYQEALETCDKAIALEPNRHNIYEVHTNRAMALNKLERHKEALEAAETALKLMPDYGLAINAKKYAVQELNKY